VASIGISMHLGKMKISGWDKERAGPPTTYPVLERHDSEGCRALSSNCGVLVTMSVRWRCGQHVLAQMAVCSA